MNFYDSLLLSNWKKLSDDQKGEMFEGVCKFFLKPTMIVDWQRLVTFKMCGMTCRTFELMIDGEFFVFIPGQKKVLLGWDFGSQGLPEKELRKAYSTEEEAFFKTFKATFAIEELEDVIIEKDQESEKRDDLFLEDLDQYINQKTSPLRQVDIPPMIVAKTSQGIGTVFKGDYHIVSGSFIGDTNFFTANQQGIESGLHPTLTLEESLSWSYPKRVFQSDQFYLEQSKTNGDYYQLYDHQEMTYGEMWLTLHQKGFQLLSADSWEYAVGGGTRRLFRWGNELLLDSSHPFMSAKNKSKEENMFGIMVNEEANFYELTDRSDQVKLEIVRTATSHLIERLLPSASYYQGNHQVNLKEKLDPRLYHYRKAIVIDPH